MFRRSNKPSECCRIFEHISRFDRAIGVLQEFNMFDEAIASLRRYKEKKVNISIFLFLYYITPIGLNMLAFVNFVFASEYLLRISNAVILVNIKICVWQKKAF